MKILITGAAGFIGSHVAGNLAKFGHDLVLIDRFSDYYEPSYKRERINHFLNEGSDLVLGIDVLESDLTRLMEELEIEVVLHLAAQPGVRVEYPKSLNYLSDNIEGFSRVLNAALDARVKKFIYASSSSVYERTASEEFTESSELLPPKNLYAFTKWLNEATADKFLNKTETKVLGLRLFSVYGPWGRPDMAPLRLVTSCLTDYKFILNGDGQTRRDFTFIEDVVTAVTHLIESESMPTGILNIGGGHDRSILELITICEKSTGVNLNFQQNLSTDLELFRTKADSNKLNHLTGLIPGTSLEDGMEITIKWASQPHILGNLKAWVESV